MKKIISLILSAVFLLSGYVSFQKHGEAAQNQIYDKLDLLQFLEIWETVSIGTILPITTI